jgi:hypothetical protein
MAPKNKHKHSSVSRAKKRCACRKDTLFALNACSAPISETDIIEGVMLPRLLRVRAPTRPIFFDLACDPVPFALPCIFTGSLASQQPVEAASNDSVIHFMLTRAQRRVEHIFLLGRKCAFDVDFEPSEEEWSENIV